jgi:hypothetical protein
MPAEDTPNATAQGSAKTKDGEIRVAVAPDPVSSTWIPEYAITGP